MSKDLKDGSDEPQHVAVASIHEEDQPKRPWWHSVKEPGSALQIVIAAAIAIGIGMAVNTTSYPVHEAAAPLVMIPGTLWLRSLKAVGKKTSISPV